MFSTSTYSAAAPNLVLRLQRLIKYTPTLTLIHASILTRIFRAFSRLSQLLAKQWLRVIKSIRH